jgi:hypothetical protein
MKKNQWQFVGDSIRFDWNGDLVDGQHRLVALQQYGEPLEFVVVEGLDPESAVVIDTGKSRSAGDAVSLMGVGYATTISAAVRTIILFKTGRYHDPAKAHVEAGVSNTDIVVFVKRHPGLEDTASYIQSLHKQFKYIPASMLCALYFILGTKNATKAELFFDKYATGIDLGEKSPIRVLRNRLIQNAGNASQYTHRDKMALFIFAWNAFMRGKEIDFSMIKLRGDYTFPQPI